MADRVGGLAFSFRGTPLCVSNGEAIGFSRSDRIASIGLPQRSNKESLPAVKRSPLLIWTEKQSGARGSSVSRRATDRVMAEAQVEGAKIIDGKAIGKEIHDGIRGEITVLKERYGKVPGLAVVIVGERKDSQTYVRMKRKACAEVGIKSIDVNLPEQSTEEEILKNVQDLNANPEVHGILVQLPLPKHVNEEKVLQCISIEKDVDGFHPLNIGMLCMKGREPLAQPCTPKGCIELLVRSGIPISGKKAVVVGRSNIVGMPVALLLNKLDATVTIVHSRTKDAESIVKQADIVICASGQPKMIKGDWIKPGAAVIDVGTNPVEDATKKAGYRIVGDADFDEVKKVAGWITPVPGGVGPMTIAMLLQNTLNSAKRTFSVAA